MASANFLVDGSRPRPQAIQKSTPSFMGFRDFVPAQGFTNIGKLKQKENRAQSSVKGELNYKPKVSQSFLQEWLDYPVDRLVNTSCNSLSLWFVWLRWTNRAIAGLDPVDNSIRARVCNQLQVLGTAASLFLVIAVASFLVPPSPREEHDHYLVNVFGCLMFTASVCLILYIALALTAIFPLIESLRDDIAFDAFEHYQRRLGGKETYLFFSGMILVLVAMLIAARILYTNIAVFVMGATTVVACWFVQRMGREVFLALDPISSMHLGLTNDPEDHNRAELLSHFILRKIPNTLITVDGCDMGKEVFEEKRESQKLEHTRLSQKANPNKERLSVCDELSRKGEVDSDEDVVGFNRHSSVDTTGAVVTNAETAGADAQKVQMLVMDIEGGMDAIPAANSSRTLTIESVRQFGSQHPETFPPLQQLFCHPEKYVFKAAGLSLVDSVAVYAYVTQAGCASTEQLLKFLKESKQYRPCTCSRDSSADAGSPAHSDQCSSSRAGVWAQALINLGVPCFHAFQVVQGLRTLL